MNDKKSNDPSPAEWRVLSLVWEEGPYAAREVIDALKTQVDWSDSTVKTLLRRLVEKGHLQTRKVGNSFLYTGAGSPMGVLKRSGDSLLQRASRKTIGPLLAHLVESSELSQKDLDELKAMIEAMSKEGES